MVYNITLLENVTNPANAAGFINYESGGIVGILFIVILIVLITIYAIRNNMREYKAIFYALLITLLPAVMLSLLEFASTTFIPPWYIILHITLLAIAGAFTYLNK